MELGCHPHQHASAHLLFHWAMGQRRFQVTKDCSLLAGVQRMKTRLKIYSRLFMQYKKKNSEKLNNRIWYSVFGRIRYSAKHLSCIRPRPLCSYQCIPICQLSNVWQWLIYTFLKQNKKTDPKNPTHWRLNYRCINLKHCSFDTSKGNQQNISSKKTQTQHIYIWSTYTFGKHF